jgi:hypothetical protein
MNRFSCASERRGGTYAYHGQDEEDRHEANVYEESIDEGETKHQNGDGGRGSSELTWQRQSRDDFVLLRMGNPELVALVVEKQISPLRRSRLRVTAPVEMTRCGWWYPALGSAPDGVPRFVTVPIESASVAACLLVSRNRIPVVMTLAACSPAQKASCCKPCEPRML